MTEGESRFHYLEIGRRVQRQWQEMSAPAAARQCLRMAETIGAFGTDLGEFNKPGGLCLDAEGGLYVADALNHRVQKITPDGDVYGLGGPDLLVNPQGVVVDSSRFIYVIEQGADRLRKFSDTGYLVFTLGGPNARVARFSCPTAICMDSYHHLYIADTENSRVTCYSATGQWQRDYHGPSSGLDGSRPQGVAVDTEGRVYVSDTMRHRIIRLRGDGDLDFAFGKHGSEPGEMDEPRGLAADADGGIWVADTGNDRVQKFMPDGQVVCCYPEPGRRNGKLADPIAVVPDGQGNIYVSDALNHRIVRLVFTGDTW
jgi:DNA-binding beta-propeller fold protein YncE